MAERGESKVIIPPAVIPPLSIRADNYVGREGAKKLEDLTPDEVARNENRFYRNKGVSENISNLPEAEYQETVSKIGEPVEWDVNVFEGAQQVRVFGGLRSRGCSYRANERLKDTLHCLFCQWSEGFDTGGRPVTPEQYKQQLLDLLNHARPDYIGDAHVPEGGTVREYCDHLELFNAGSLLDPYELSIASKQSCLELAFPADQYPEEAAKIAKQSEKDRAWQVNMIEGNSADAAARRRLKEVTEATQLEEWKHVIKVMLSTLKKEDGTNATQLNDLLIEAKITDYYRDIAQSQKGEAPDTSEFNENTQEQAHDKQTFGVKIDHVLKQLEGTGIDLTIAFGLETTDDKAGKAVGKHANPAKLQGIIKELTDRSITPQFYTLIRPALMSEAHGIEHAIKTVMDVASAYERILEEDKTLDKTEQRKKPVISLAPTKVLKGSTLAEYESYREHQMRWWPTVEVVEALVDKELAGEAVLDKINFHLGLSAEGMDIAERGDAENCEQCNDAVKTALTEFSADNDCHKFKQAISAVHELQCDCFQEWQHSGRRNEAPIEVAHSNKKLQSNQVKAVAQLDESSILAGQKLTKEQIAELTSNFPDGCHLAYEDGQVVGACVSRMEESNNGTFGDVQPSWKGDIIHVASFGVEGEYRGGEVEERLLESLQDTCRTMKRRFVVIDSVINHQEFKRYQAYYAQNRHELSLHMYAHLRNTEGEPVDENVRLFELCGFVPREFAGEDAADTRITFVWENPDYQAHESENRKVAHTEVIQTPSLDELIAFERVSWDPSEQASEQELAARLEAFPEGIFMLRADGENVTQITVLPKVLPANEQIEGFEHLSTISIDRSSKRLWTANMAARPEVGQGKGYPKQLLAHVICWAAEHGYESMAGCATCHRFAEMLQKGRVASIDEYMARGMNPVVRIFDAAAEIARARGVRCASWHLAPKKDAWTDASSAGWGVIVGIKIEQGV